MSNHSITLVEGVQHEVYPQCSLYEAEHNDASVMCTEATMSSRPARGGVTTKGGNNMKLQELYNMNNQYQVVLSFSNNDMVLITDESFHPNSKFMRRSRIRLKQDFMLVESTGTMDIYCTFRGGDKNDYVLYVNRGDYMVLHLFKEYKSHKTVISTTKNRSPKHIQGTPDREPVIHAYPHALDDEVWVIFSYNSDVLHEEHFPKRNEPDNWRNYYNHYVAVLKTMSILVNNPQLHTGVKQLIIHTGESSYNKQITWNVLLGKYKAHNYWTQHFYDSFNALKQKLQTIGITVSYDLEEVA